MDLTDTQIDRYDQMLEKAYEQQTEFFCDKYNDIFRDLYDSNFNGSQRDLLEKSNDMLLHFISYLDDTDYESKAEEQYAKRFREI